MSKTALTLSILLTACAGTARADPSVDLVNGAAVHIVLPEGKLVGFALRPTADGWWIELGALGPGAFVELTDITPGSLMEQTVLGIANGAILLDRDRFRGDHVYRMQVLGDRHTNGRAFVYLYPRAARAFAPLRKHSRAPGNLRSAPRRLLSDGVAAPCNDAATTRPAICDVPSA